MKSHINETWKLNVNNFLLLLGILCFLWSCQKEDQTQDSKIDFDNKIHITEKLDGNGIEYEKYHFSEWREEYDQSLSAVYHEDETNIITLCFGNIRRVEFGWEGTGTLISVDVDESSLRESYIGEINERTEFVGIFNFDSEYELMEQFGYNEVDVNRVPEGSIFRKEILFRINGSGQQIINYNVDGEWAYRKDKIMDVDFAVSFNYDEIIHYY